MNSPVIDVGDSTYAATEAKPRGEFPPSIKFGWTAWVLVLVRVRIGVPGLQRFLWLSDVGLIGACAALWLESRVLTSVMAIGIVLPDHA